ncbi:MAG: hypothetical protein V4684_03125 [Pseudomonadota bacterium]
MSSTLGLPSTGLHRGRPQPARTSHVPRPQFVTPGPLQGADDDWLSTVPLAARSRLSPRALRLMRSGD